MKMDYLEQLLGIKIKEIGKIEKDFPNYISSRYVIKEMTLEGKVVLFVYPKVEITSLPSIRNHINKIKEVNNTPIVLVLEKMTYRQKEFFLKERIPFIVYEKQIYLPFVGVYLQKRSDVEKEQVEKLWPATQLVFLYYLYQKEKEVQTSKIVTDLSITSTTVARAVKQLEILGLLNINKKGIQRIISTDLSHKELFRIAEKYLQNPVKRTIYVDKKIVDNELVKSGYSALSEYSMLNEDKLQVYASNNISKWKTYSNEVLFDDNSQIALELYRYDPRKLAINNNVDPISLYLSLKNDEDERVEIELEKMMEEVWNGKWNR